MAAMAESSPSEVVSGLGARLAALGRTLGAREADHAPAIARAQACAESVRSDVAAALSQFHAAAADAGAPHLQIALSSIRTDDKHLRAVEFDLSRGRHQAIVVAKAKGELTLVGPFKQGKVEGPCLSFPFDARDEIQRALGTFLEKFLEEAATP
jgi:hypothetical protein